MLRNRIGLVNRASPRLMVAQRSRAAPARCVRTPHQRAEPTHCTRTPRPHTAPTCHARTLRPNTALLACAVPAHRTRTQRSYTAPICRARTLRFLLAARLYSRRLDLCRTGGLCTIVNTIQTPAWICHSEGESPKNLSGIDSRRVFSFIYAVFNFF